MDADVYKQTFNNYVAKRLRRTHLNPPPEPLLYVINLFVLFVFFVVKNPIIDRNPILPGCELVYIAAAAHRYMISESL